LARLYIYDSNSGASTNRADSRFDSDETCTVGVGNTAQLLAALDGLVTRGAVFDRVLLQTRGGPGHIRFGDEIIWDITLKERFASRSYHTLFPLYTRIYFDGCNVANGSLGTEFLAAAGSIFLRSAGGEVLAFNNPGYGLPGWVPIIGGDTLRFGGQLRKLYFAPGGEVIARRPYVRSGPHGHYAGSKS